MPADSPDGDAEYSSRSESVDDVRYLASHGKLAERAATPSRTESTLLFGSAYKIVMPVVFESLTRAIERGRGHHDCASGVKHLRPDCLDRYQDDVKAVVDDLLRNATVPIHNLEGWVRSRLMRATIDGYRRRRGERGAVQRPRMTKWLAKHLGDDRWLRALAIHIQAWVGTAATAGSELWPYGAWLERRIAVTGDASSTEQDVARDVETVLAAMRQNPAWYEKFIERPLGRKEAPLLASDGSAADPMRERSQLALVQRHEADDALLSALASGAIDAMAVRIARGEDRHLVVVDIIGTVFGSGTGAEHLDQPPGAGSGEDERVRLLLADPDSIDRLVHQVLEILDIPNL